MTAETLTDLTRELGDFLDLPDVLGLPPLHSVECRRTATTQWSVSAFLATKGDTEAWDAIGAWAAVSGAAVTVSRPYASSTQPSGMQRTLEAVISVAGTRIVLRAAVDAMFVPPQTAEAVAS